MAPAGNNNNSALVLSEKVGVSLEEAVANVDLLNKSLSASDTDQLQLEVERDELKAEKLELQAERAEFKAEKLEWEASKGGAGSSSTTNSELEAAKEQLKADKLELDALKAQLKIAESQLKDCHAQLQAAKSELETAHKQLDEARVELEVARSHLEAAKAQADINSTKLEAAKASLEAAKARFEAATKQLNAAKSRFEAAKSQLDSAGATLEADKSQLEDAKAALEKKMSEAESKNAILDKEILRLSSELQQCTSHVGGLAEKMEELWTELEQCEKDKKTMVEVELPGLREKVKELEELLKQCGEEKKEPAESEKPHVQGNGNPKVFFDLYMYVSTKPYFSQVGRKMGRIVMELHAESTPITAENFRALCTGEKGKDGSGALISYKGSTFRPITSGATYCTGGVIIVRQIINGAPSVYDSSFPAENLTKKHIGPGILSMDSHTADDTSMSHGSRFFISTATDDFLDGKQVVFGQVLEGFEFVREIMWADGHYAQIAECGQLNS